MQLSWWCKEQYEQIADFQLWTQFLRTIFELHVLQITSSESRNRTDSRFKDGSFHFQLAIDCLW